MRIPRQTVLVAVNFLPGDLLNLGFVEGAVVGEAVDNNSFLVVLLVNIINDASF